jgi:lysozyme family protein
MQHPFLALAGEYTALLARMVITRPESVRAVAERLLEFKPRYAAVWAETGVPIIELAGINERESGSRFNTYLGNGDSLSHPTVDVPRGRGPFNSWEAGARDALHLDGLDQVRNAPGGWTWPRACYEGELYNGFGPRAHGIHTGYLWAGTNNYDRGKYTSDGHWDPSVRDAQLGIIPLMVTMLALDPSLSLNDPLPGAPLIPRLDHEMIPQPLPVPLGHGGGDPDHDTKWIQATLNLLNPKNPITIDGIWGRETRRAVVAFQQAEKLEPDGIAGPLTIAALEEALHAEAS